MNRFWYSLILFVCLCIRCSDLLATETPQEQQLKRIDTDIESLQQELQRERQHSFNAEMQTLPQMFDKWDGYVQDVQHAEEDEEKILQIKRKIDELSQQRSAIEEEIKHSTE